MAFDINTAVIDENQDEELINSIKATSDSENKETKFDINTATIDENQDDEFVALFDMQEAEENKPQYYLSEYKPKNPVDDKPKNLVDNFIDSLKWTKEATSGFWTQGRDQTRTADLEIKDMFGRLNSAETRELDNLSNKEYKDYGLIEPTYKQKDPFTITGALERTPYFVKKGYTEAVKMLPQLWQLMTRSAAGAATGAGVGATGALVAGQLGPQAATPEEVVTVPTAAIGGAVWGARIASSLSVAELEAGLTRNELKKINQEIRLEGGEELSIAELNGLSVAVGAVNAGLELVGLKQLLKTVPGGDKILKQLERKQLKELAKDKTLRSKLAEIYKEYGKAILTESTTEMLQETSNIVAEHYARKIGGIEDDTIGENLKNNIPRIIETGVVTAGSMMWLGGFGSLSKTTYILGKQGMNQNEAQQTAQNMTMQERLYLISENMDTLMEAAKTVGFNKIDPKRYDKLTEGMKQAGINEQLINDNLTVVNKIDEVLLSKYDAEGEATKLINNRNLKLNFENALEKVENDVKEKQNEHAENKIKSNSNDLRLYEKENSAEYKQLRKDAETIITTAIKKTFPHFSDKQVKNYLTRVITEKDYKNLANKKISEKIYDAITDKLDDKIESLGGLTGFPELSYENRQDVNYESVIQKALNILKGKNISDELSLRENEEAEYYESIVNGVKERLDNAETIEELFEIYDNASKVLSKEIQTEFVYNELLESVVKNAERIEKETEQRRVQAEADGTEGSTPRLYSRPMETSDEKFDRRNDYGKSEEERLNFYQKYNQSEVNLKNKYLTTENVYDNFASFEELQEAFKNDIEEAPKDYEISDLNEALKDLGITENKPKEVKTPYETIQVRARNIEHIINSEGDKSRYKSINRMFATLERPNIITINEQGKRAYFKIFEDNNKTKRQITYVSTDEQGNFVLTTIPVKKESWFLKQINNGRIIFDRRKGVIKNSPVNNSIANSDTDFKSDVIFDGTNPNIYYQGTNNIKEQLQRKDGKIIDVEYYDNSDIQDVAPLNIRKLKFENIKDVKDIKHRNIKDLIFNNKNKISIKNNRSEINAALSSRNVDEMLNSIFKERNSDKNLYRLKKEIIANIETIFENAIPVLKHAELKNENLFDKQVIHRFALPIKIGNNNFLTMITVKERTDFKEAKIDEFSIYDLNSQKDEMVARNWQDKNLNHIGNHTYSMNDITDFVNSNLDKYKVTLNQNNYNNNTADTNHRASIEFKDDETIISLAKSSDASSVMHEFAHLYLHDLKELAKVNKRAEADFNEVCKTFNFDPNSDYGLDEFLEFHENFARSFEAYLLNGEAPTSKMKPIFERFKEFLREVYHHLTDLNVEFSPEVKECFDRLFTTDEEYEKEVKPLYIKNDELVKAINEQNTFKQRFKNNTSSVKKAWDNFYDTAIIPIETRLYEINPELKKILRKHTFDLTMEQKKDSEKIKPFLLKVMDLKKNNVIVELNGQNLNAYNWLSFALNNADGYMVNKIIKKLNMEKEFKAVRDLLDDLYGDMKEVGMEVGYLESYFPRKVKADKTDAFVEMFEKKAFDEDVDITQGFLDEKDAEYSNVLRQIKEKDEYALWSNEDKAKLINTSIRGFGKNNILLSRVGNTKFGRQIDKLTPEQQQFYEPIENALSSYVLGARKNIEERKFFGIENKDVSKLRASIKKKKETLREVKTRTPKQAKGKEEKRLKYELSPIEIKLETISGELKTNKKRLKSLNDESNVSDDKLQKLKETIKNQSELIKTLRDRKERLKSQLEWTEKASPYVVKAVVKKRIIAEIDERSEEIKNILGDTEHVEDSVGRLVMDLAQKGVIYAKDERVIRELLVSRFNSVRLNTFANGVRDVSTLVTLNDFTNAITQFQDLAFSAFKFGVFNTIEGIKRPENLTREDLGLNNIAEEFRKTSDLSKWVNKQLKLIGLELIDGFAKNTAINASIISARKKAKSNNKKFDEKLKFLFDDKANQVKQDLIDGKITDDIIFIAFNDIADIQPITTDQMTAGYQSVLRPLYVLKTYSIKALDLFRNECLFKITDGMQQIKKGNKEAGKELLKEGVGNIIKLQMLYWLFGVPQELLKDVFLNKEFDIPESFLDNLIIFAIFSRYLVKKSSKNPASIYEENVKIPALQAVGDVWSGANDVRTSKKDIKDLYVWSRVPIVGKMYYSWLGGKKDKRVEL